MFIYGWSVFMIWATSIVFLSGWEAQQISKGVNKACLFYVELTVTVHIVLFYWRVNPIVSMHWLVVLLHFNTFCVLCTVKANEQKKQRTKTYNKETGDFLYHSRFINYGQS